MVKVILEPARNGVIKKVIDDNHGGGREQATSLEVYEESGDNDLDYVMRFFFDICEDLGVKLGNKFGKEVITIRKEWGSHYEPTDEDVNAKIKELEAELQSLKEWKKS